MTSHFAVPNAVQALEAALGDPRGSGPLGWQRAVQDDELERFPEESFALLSRLGLHHHYVPQELGGSLASLDTLGQLVRLVARRDLTVAIAHGKTFLGAVPVWVGGDLEQRTTLARGILDENLPESPDGNLPGNLDQNLPGNLDQNTVALALTEKDVGTDLTSIGCRAMASGDEYRLDGEKWLVNNATRARWLSVLARTQEAPGPRSCSLLLVDKKALSKRSARPLPKIRTHGIRGADISGIRFENARVPGTARIGAEGHGLEIALRGLLVTRSLIGSLSLGAAESALDVVLSFARARRIRDKRVLDLDHPRSVLGNALGDLLLCEAVCRIAARAVHVVPSQVSVFAAVTKYLVPTTVDGLIRDLSVVLGARHYVREEHEHGVFQKLARDAQLVGLFDGSTIVNLSSLGLQLPRLCDRRRRAEATDALSASETLAALCSLERPVPPFSPEQLSLVAHGRSVILDAWPRVREDCVHQLEGDGVTPHVRDSLRLGMAALDEALAREPTELDVLVARGEASSDSALLFALAERHTALFAATLCLEVWCYNRAQGDAFFASGEWLSVCVTRCLRRAGCLVATPRRSVEALVERLLWLEDNGLSLSLFPFPRAKAERMAP